jgi:HEAT repeat protein
MNRSKIPHHWTPEMVETYRNRAEPDRIRHEALMWYVTGLTVGDLAQHYDVPQTVVNDWLDEAYDEILWKLREEKPENQPKQGFWKRITNNWGSIASVIGLLILIIPAFIQQLGLVDRPIVVNVNLAPSPDTPEKKDDSKGNQAILPETLPTQKDEPKEADLPRDGMINLPPEEGLEDPDLSSVAPNDSKEKPEIPGHHDSESQTGKRDIQLPESHERPLSDFQPERDKPKQEIPEPTQLQVNPRIGTRSLESSSDRLKAFGTFAKELGLGLARATKKKLQQEKVEAETSEIKPEKPEEPSTSIPDSSDVLQWIDNLDNPDGMVQVVSASKLLELKDSIPDDVPIERYILVHILVQALVDARREVGQAAFAKLNDIADQFVVLHAEQALTSPNAEARLSAVQKLAEVGGVVAVSALIETLKDSDEKVRQKVTVAFEKHKLLETHKTWVISALREKALNKDEQESVRNSIVMALGDFGNPAAILTLTELLSSSESARLRQSAAFALGQIRDSRAVPTLIKVLNDNDHRVRENAADALEKIGAPEALEALKNFKSLSQE